jgi:hypothetical protein
MTRIVFAEHSDDQFEYLYGYVPAELVPLEPVGNTIGRAFRAYSKAEYGSDQLYAMVNFIETFIDEVGVTRETLTDGDVDNHLHHLGRLMNQAEFEVEEMRIVLHENVGAVSGDVTFGDGRAVAWKSDASALRHIDAYFITEAHALNAVEGDLRIVETETSVQIDLPYKTPSGVIGVAVLVAVSRGYAIAGGQFSAIDVISAWAYMVQELCQTERLEITSTQEALLRGMQNIRS